MPQARLTATQAVTSACVEVHCWLYFMLKEQTILKFILFTKSALRPMFQPLSELRPLAKSTSISIQSIEACFACYVRVQREVVGLIHLLQKCSLSTKIKIVLNIC